MLKKNQLNWFKGLILAIISVILIVVSLNIYNHSNTLENKQVAIASQNKVDKKIQKFKEKYYMNQVNKIKEVSKSTVDYTKSAYAKSKDYTVDKYNKMKNWFSKGKEKSQRNLEDSSNVAVPLNIDQLNKKEPSKDIEKPKEKEIPLQDIEELKTEAKDVKSLLNTQVIIFVVLTLVLLMFYFITDVKVFTFFILTASLIAWAVGIFTPIMSVEIFKELPLIDYTVLKYETKSIYKTIEKLWLLENYVISILVMLFSVIIPIIKTIAMYLHVVMNVNIKYIELLGKWSMSDVFVISLLITNLSLNADKFTKAETQIALYFFSAYVILSIIASVLIKYKIDKPQKALEAQESTK